MKENAYAMIMAGGLGERFWPATSRMLPKYAIEFKKNTTFLKETYDRLKPIYGPNRIYVVTAKEHDRLIRRILPQMPSVRILAEPRRCNTAAATVLASLYLKARHGDDAIVSFYPADALIQKKLVFQAAIKQSIRLADATNGVVVLGVKPTRPATGYGYIERGQAEAKYDKAFKVKKFHEKPELKTAEAYLKKKSFYWNAGIFTWKVKPFLESVHEVQPAFIKSFKRLGPLPWVQVTVAKIYQSLKKAPVDKLIIEKLKNLWMIEAPMDWDDIGSWDALRRMSQNASGNVLGAGVQVDEVKDSLILMDQGQSAMVAGLSDVIVVQKGKSILICHKDMAEKVKDFKVRF